MTGCDTGARVDLNDPELREWRAPRLDVTTLLDRLALFEAEAADEFVQLEAIGPRPTLPIVYERAFRDAGTLRATFRELFEFLEVEPIDLPIAHRKMRPWRFDEAVANPGEVAEVLRGTRFERLLDPDHAYA